MKGREKMQKVFLNSARNFVMFVLVAGFGTLYGHQAQAAPADVCNRMLTADVVAIDMPLMWNRLGQWHDVCATTGRCGQYNHGANWRWR